MSTRKELELRVEELLESERQLIARCVHLIDIIRCYNPDDALFDDEKGGTTPITDEMVTRQLARFGIVDPAGAPEPRDMRGQHEPSHTP